jgi:hypothetical protein
VFSFDGGNASADIFCQIADGAPIWADTMQAQEKPRLGTAGVGG